MLVIIIIIILQAPRNSRGGACNEGRNYNEILISIYISFGQLAGGAHCAPSPPAKFYCIQNSDVKLIKKYISNY